MVLAEVQKLIIDDVNANDYNMNGYQTNILKYFLYYKIQKQNRINNFNFHRITSICWRCSSLPNDLVIDNNHTIFDFLFQLFPNLNRFEFEDKIPTPTRHEYKNHDQVSKSPIINKMIKYFTSLRYTNGTNELLRNGDKLRHLKIDLSSQTDWTRINHPLQHLFDLSNLKILHLHIQFPIVHDICLFAKNSKNNICTWIEHNSDKEKDNTMLALKEFCLIIGGIQNRITKLIASIFSYICSKLKRNMTINFRVKLSKPCNSINVSSTDYQVVLRNLINNVFQKQKQLSILAIEVPDRITISPLLKYEDFRNIVEFEYNVIIQQRAMSQFQDMYDFITTIPSTNLKNVRKLS